MTYSNILILASGILVGFAWCDLLITWGQKRWVSIDALFILALAGVCGIGAVFTN